jgi:ABC-type branched-subunit amino acid transport system substrate-binding protein
MMKPFRHLISATLCLALAPAAWAEPKLALLGLSEDKSVESLSAQIAVDAANTSTAGLRLKLWAVPMTTSAEANVAAARRVADDADVLAVVLHGEAAAAPEVLQVLREAGLAVVSASSWAQPRPADASVTWLCPSQNDLAETAAVYAKAKQGGKATQVAVVDNGAPTSAAAAKAFASRFRALGGKVVQELTYSGDDEALTRTTKALKAHWPQMVFFTGEGADAGRLVVAMKDEKELKPTDLIGMPSVFEPGFFNTARLKSLRTRGLFPCPDFAGGQPLARLIGIGFPKASAEYRAYLAYAYKKPGRWTSMIFDASQLAARAVASAGKTPADLSATAAAEAPAFTVPSREAVRLALNGTESYRGIRGVVKFSATREPAEARAMFYYALNRVNKKEMQWREKNYGPPF